MHRRDVLRRVGSLTGIGALALLSGRLTTEEAAPDPPAEGPARRDAASTDVTSADGTSTDVTPALDPDTADDTSTDVTSAPGPSTADPSAAADVTSFTDEAGTATDFTPAIGSPKGATNDDNPSREAVAERIRETHATRCRCPVCGGGSMPGRP